MVSSSLSAVGEEQKKPPSAAAAAAAVAAAPEQNKLKQMFPEATKKTPSAAAPELPRLQHRLFAKKPSPPSKQQQDETATTAPFSSNKRVKRAQHDESTNANVESGTSKKAIAQQLHHLPIVIRGSASHKVLQKLGRLIPESLRDGPPEDDEEETVGAAQEADGVKTNASVPSETSKANNNSLMGVSPSNKTEKPENVLAKLNIDRAVEEESKLNDKEANTSALAKSTNGNKEQAMEMKIDKVDGFDAYHPPNDAVKDAASADSRKASSVPAPSKQSSKDPESSASAMEIEHQAGTKKNGEAAKTMSTADEADGAKKDESGAASEDPAKGTNDNTLGTDAAIAAATTASTMEPSHAEDAPVNKPLRFCFRSCVMPQPSMYTRRNSYRVVISQGPHQGRSGHVVRELEGKWSVIQADDGKEPVQYTASNMHLRMVAALDKSLRPRRQYTKRKNKDKATNKALVSASAASKKRDTKPSAEDLFLACLEEQLKHTR